MKYCACHKPLKLREAVQGLLDELKEFVEEPSMDEASDIAYCVGRLTAGLFGKEYFPIPGDGIHVRKIRERMQKHACIRSERHLKDGRCPSL